MTEGDVTLRFWGVRGSIPVCSPETRRGGGNTACVEVRCGGRIVILDAGSGIREAGLALREEKAKEADIFLTHAHWDHIIGLPFYKPLFCTGMATTVWSGHLAGIRRRMLLDLVEFRGANLITPPWVSSGSTAQPPRRRRSRAVI